MCNTKAIFFDGIRKKTGTAEEKWNPSFGHLSRLHQFNGREQISTLGTHLASLISFHVFFLHIRLNKLCCHFRIIDYIFFQLEKSLLEHLHDFIAVYYNQKYV